MLITWLAGKIASPILQGFVGILVPILLIYGGYSTVKNLWYSWWEKPKLEKEIADLQIISIKQQASIYRLQAEKKDQQVMIKYREKKANETSKIDQVAGAGDDAGMDNIFVGLGMLPPRPTGPAANPARGHPGH